MGVPYLGPDQYILTCSTSEYGRSESSILRTFSFARKSLTSTNSSGECKQMTQLQLGEKAVYFGMDKVWMKLISNGVTIYGFTSGSAYGFHGLDFEPDLDNRYSRNYKVYKYAHL